MSKLDDLQIEDQSPTSLTRDVIGLCIGVLSVVLLIVIIALFKWSRCICLKQSPNNFGTDEELTSVIQPNITVPYTYRHNNRSQNQRVSSCNHTGNVYPTVSTTRNGLLSSPQRICLGNRPLDAKVSLVTTTSLSVQTSQQLVPRLSISPQMSGSSITRSINSIGQ